MRESLGKGVSGGPGRRGTSTLSGPGGHVDGSIQEEEEGDDDDPEVLERVMLLSLEEKEREDNEEEEIMRKAINESLTELMWTQDPDNCRIQLPRPD